MMRVPTAMIALSFTPRAPPCVHASMNPADEKVCGKNVGGYVRISVCVLNAVITIQYSGSAVHKIPIATTT